MELIKKFKRKHIKAWRAYRRWWRDSQRTEIWFMTDGMSYPFRRKEINFNEYGDLI